MDEIQKFREDYPDFLSMLFETNFDIILAYLDTIQWPVSNIIESYIMFNIIYSGSAEFGLMMVFENNCSFEFNEIIKMQFIPDKLDQYNYITECFLAGRIL